MNLYSIIVAGGQGTRMKRDMPKQFIPLGNMPILMHTIQRFLQYPQQMNLILVLPEREVQTWESLSSGYNFDTRNIQVVIGGETRFRSVSNGLNKIKDDDAIVSIHDGVRPFIKKETIAQCIQVAKEKGNAVAAVPLKESIRRLYPDGSSSALDRKEYYLIQTPQVFMVSQIKRAYEKANSDAFTDDASVAENAGYNINILEGSYENIKITTPEDLIVAEAVLKNFQY